MMKTHLELYGWEIQRVQFPWQQDDWFNLNIRGFVKPYAGGPLPFIAKVLQRHLGDKR